MQRSYGMFLSRMPLTTEGHGILTPTPWVKHGSAVLREAPDSNGQMLPKAQATKDRHIRNPEVEHRWPEARDSEQGFTQV